MKENQIKESLSYSQKIEFVASDEVQRLDALLACFEEIPSRSFAEKLINDGRVFVNGARRSKSYKVKPGEKIEVYLPVEDELELKPYDIDLEIVYLDDHLVVVDKPSGLVVHPAHGHYEDTLINALIAKDITLSPAGAPLRPGVVHRLDKDTSGLIVLARTRDAHMELQKAIKERRVKRIYKVLSCGNIYRSRFQIEAPITRHRKEIVKMTVDFERGKNAYTYFEVLRNYRNFTYLKAELGTGRTHQIRVHLASIGHPVAGDPIYGGIKCSRALPLKRLFLHATRLEFRHPATGKMMAFESELPEELKKTLDYLDENFA